MPIYEFKCDRCKRHFESFVLSSRGVRDVRCPSCGAEGVRKLMSGFNCSSAGQVSGGASHGAGCTGGSPRFR